jgi:putative ABC transport system permease protein
MEWDQPIGKGVGRGQVVGVIGDFHYMPLHEEVQPLYLSPYMDDFFDSLSERRRQALRVDVVISVTGNNPVETRDYIQQVVRRFTSQSLVEVVTLDNIWSELYTDDTQAINLVGFFSVLSIVISLMGLSGLAAYSTQQRSKEIAVRKVLGASVSSLLGLLSLDMAKIFLIAVLPAILGAYYLSSVWLERFAYRVEFSPFPYLTAVSVIGAISFLAIIAQTYRTAQANPVIGLKYE